MWATAIVHSIIVASLAAAVTREQRRTMDETRGRC